MTGSGHYNVREGKRTGSRTNAVRPLNDAHVIQTTGTHDERPLNSVVRSGLGQSNSCCVRSLRNGKLFLNLD